MDDTLTIHTSDGATLTVKRVHLLANSSVFADMMASASGSSVDLIETEEQLKPFLDALGGDLGAFEKLDEGGLEKFARLADKYDSFVGKALVKAKIWEFDSEKEHSLSAFVLSTILDDFDLAKHTALSAYVKGSIPPSYPRISSEWEQRVSRWNEQLEGHALRVYIRCGTRPIPLYFCKGCQNKAAVEVWHAIGAELTLSAHFVLAKPFTTASEHAHVCYPQGFCTAHKQVFDIEVQTAENKNLSALLEIPKA